VPTVSIALEELSTCTQDPPAVPAKIWETALKIPVCITAPAEMKKIASSVGVWTVGRAGIVKNASITIPLTMVAHLVLLPSLGMALAPSVKKVNLALSPAPALA